MGKLLAVIVLLFAGVFGYFMSQNSWDITLTKAVMVYEFNKLIGDEDAELPVEKQVMTDDEAAPAPTGVSHNKDSIYQGSGNSGEAKFSDVKKEGVNDSYN